ncbi:hypothetical protein HQQ81_19055 [Microbacteriaceae bacterium VKM Ac-2854]|nr:hypothetical protein [Microbacteriaceae bacterium VKM Ac-2854]
MSSVRRAARLALAALAAMAGLLVTAPIASAAALSIDSPSTGTLLDSGTVTVTGSGSAGSQIQVSDASGGDPLCIVTVDAAESWNCGLDLGDGPHRLTAAELLADGSTSATSIDIAVLSPPVITSVDGGTTSAGSVGGSAYPGATVTATTTDGSASCSTSADASGKWFCQLVPALGAGDYSVSATQSAAFANGASSPASAAVTLTVDAAPPAAPTMTSPTSGGTLPLSGASYSGTGEEGTTAYVYVDVVNTCEAPVIDGTWTCTGGVVEPGSHRVSAILGDAAGNYGPPSAWIDVVFADASPTPTATPTPTGSTSPTGSATPTASASASPTPSATSSAGQPTPSATSSTPAKGGATPSRTGTPSAPRPSDGETALPALPGAPSDGAQPAPSVPEPLSGGDVEGGWNAATGMTTALTARAELGTFSDWVRSLALAAISLALVVVPARLAAGSRAPRESSAPRWQLTGRNRARVEFETVPEAPALSRRTVAVGVIGCAAGLVLLSGPVSDQPAYIRLLIAVVVAIVAVNVVAAGVPALVARRLAVGSVAVVPAPKALLIVAAAALGSRFAGLDPAFLFGVVVGLALAPSASAADRAKLATVRVVALLALAGVAWALSGAVPADGTFVATLLAEVLSATTLLSIGSAVVLLFPIGRPAGQAILRWSPVLWLGLTLMSYTVLFLLLTPTLAAWQSGGGGAVVALIVVGFAAVCTSVWAWRRFVE